MARLLALAALFTSALCFTITEPSESKPWLQNAPDNRVVWTVEAGDPAIIGAYAVSAAQLTVTDIRLVAKNQRKLNGALALGASIQASAGQLVVPYLASAAGAGYHIVFTGVTDDTAVLATSDVFEVTPTKKAATSGKDHPSGRPSGAVSMATSSGAISTGMAASSGAVYPVSGSHAATSTVQPTLSPGALTSTPSSSALSPPSQVPGSAASLASPFFAALFGALGLALLI